MIPGLVPSLLCMSGVHTIDIKCGGSDSSTCSVQVIVVGVGVVVALATPGKIKPVM